MRAAVLIAASIPALVAAQEATPKDSKKSNSMVTLIGCVTSGETAQPEYHIAGDDGAEYRLTGTDMRRYLGQRVEITGKPQKRFVVAGGLVPSPNVAAQAGAIDPPPAAAAAPATHGTAPLPELRVRSVKTVGGACPDK